MALWNFPLERISATGERYLPTRVLFPDWLTMESQNEGERNFSRVREIRTRIIDREFNLEWLNLVRSPLFPHLPVALDGLDLLPKIKADVPIDNVEIVEWMQECTADQAILSARVAEYNRYSRVVARSGDPWSPGVRVEDISIERIRGRDLIGHSFSVRTPRGTFDVPEGEGRAGIFSDLLAWAGGIGWPGVQWTGTLIKWLDLAKTPITSDIGFPVLIRSIIAPNFFVQEPSSSARRVRVRMQLTSNRDQDATLIFRSPTNYSNEIDLPATVSLARGTNELEFIIASYPSVPVVVTQVQPTVGTTVLRRYVAEAE